MEMNGGSRWKETTEKAAAVRGLPDELGGGGGEEDKRMSSELSGRLKPPLLLIKRCRIE